ncbi:MAG: hypothetical protein HZB68_03665 [Candidatus Aenigmarchaeota archaeon]|nr:hypothetical protein [Candidatus Aenigmarchaeota archaeon]
MVEILILEDWHGVKECQEWHIEKIKAEKPDAVGVEFLCSDKNIWALCDELSKGKISIDEFSKKSGIREWCMPENYLTLLKFLHGSGIRLFPMDHTSSDRKKLISFLKGAVKSASEGKDMDDMFKAYTTMLKIERDGIFTRNALNILTEAKTEKIILLVGSGHHDSLGAIFESFERDAAVKSVKSPSREAMRKEWERVNMKEKPEGVVELLCRLGKVSR